MRPASPPDPLEQKLVRLTRAGAPAHAFYAYLQGPSAHAIFARYGFDVPRTLAPSQTSQR